MTRRLQLAVEIGQIPAAIEPVGAKTAIRVLNLERERLVLLDVGLGPLKVAVRSGESAPSSPPYADTLMLPVVMIGGLQSSVIYSGLAPGLAGLYQLNVQVPAGTPTGTMTVQVSINGAASNTATVAVTR
jgi:uncharacterized protein (TIGR03437 family)